MKRGILISLALIAMVFGLGAITQTAEFAVHAGWDLVRGPINAADSGTTAIDLTSEGDFANKPSTATEIKWGGNSTASLQGAEFAISIVDATGGNAACNITFRGWSADNGMCIDLFTVTTATIGTQAVIKYPDTGAAATNGYWVHSGTVTSKAIYAEALNSGNNGALVINVPSFKGIHWVYPEVTAASNGAAGAYAIRVYRREY